ncbi:MAG: extracellular solute-binding protein [Clostridia bacterium]|nr:extracellular solute-binding protein [Clostridia bacterium]
MKKGLFKVVALGLCLILAFGLLAGCGKNSSNDVKQTQESKAAETTKAEERKQADISIFIKDAAPEVDLLSTPIAQKIFENCKVKLSIEYAVGDVETKLGVMMASGDYPDVVQLNSKENMQKYISQGIAVPIEQYIEKNESLKKVLQMKNVFKGITQKDGHIYYIPFDLGGWRQDYPSQAFFVQKAVLKEAGWPKISSIEDFWGVLEAYKNKYPTINGAKTIGYTVLSKDWQFDSITNPELFLNGFQNDGGWLLTKGGDGKYSAKFHAGTDFEKSWLKSLNAANAKGLLDKEGFVETEEQWIAKMTSGRVLASFSWGYQYYDINDALKKANMGDRAFVGIPIVADASIKDKYMDEVLPVLTYGICITKNCKDPERVVQFYNDLLSEENNKLREWGIAGEDYTVKDGKFTFTPEQLSKIQDMKHAKTRGLGIGNGWIGFPSYPGDAKYSDGNYSAPVASPEFIQTNYDETDMEFLKAYNANTYTELFSKPSTEYGYAWSVSMPEGSKEAVTRQKVDELKRSMIPAIILASADKFEELWTKYTDALSKLDINSVAKEVEKEINSRVEEGRYQ